MPQKDMSMTPGDLKNVIDTAASQSDRWMFVALLVIGLLSIWMLAKYFTRQHETLAQRLDQTNDYIRTTLATLVTESKLVIQSNSEALHKLTK